MKGSGKEKAVSRRGFLQTTGAAGLTSGLASGGTPIAKETAAMKITGIKTYKFSVPTGSTVKDPKTGELLSSAKKPWLFLKIETDSGVAGWGEGSGEWLVNSVEATLYEWQPLLLGQNPLNVVTLTEDIQNRLPWKGGPVFGTAIAAINMALYDLAGKTWGIPVHTILGGQRRERVRVYTGGPLFQSPESAVKAARSVRQRGYAGIKSNPLEARTWPMDDAVLEHDVGCVAAVRKALGADFDILLDTHGSPTPEFSLEFARRVAPYRPLFIEEPVKVGSVQALLEVSRRSPVPIATGEKLFTLGDFKPIIDQRACAILQPDVGHCFGITHALDIAKAAEQAQILMAPHGAAGPIFYGATLAVDAATNPFLIQETNYFEQFDRYVEHEWKIRKGYVDLSHRPGLGVEVKEQDLAKLEYEPLPYRQYRHADGSWKGW